MSQSFVISAKAGIQGINNNGRNVLDPRFREDDKSYTFFKFIDKTPKISLFYVMTQSVREDDNVSEEWDVNNI